MDARTIIASGSAIVKAQAADRKQTIPYRRQYMTRGWHTPFGRDAHRSVD